MSKTHPSALERVPANSLNELLCSFCSPESFQENSKAFAELGDDPTTRFLCFDSLVAHIDRGEYPTPSELRCNFVEPMKAIIAKNIPYLPESLCTLLELRLSNVREHCKNSLNVQNKMAETLNAQPQCKGTESRLLPMVTAARDTAIVCTELADIINSLRTQRITRQMTGVADTIQTIRLDIPTRIPGEE